MMAFVVPVTRPVDSVPGPNAIAHTDTGGAHTGASSGDTGAYAATAGGRGTRAGRRIVIVRGGGGARGAGKRGGEDGVGAGLLKVLGVAPVFAGVYVGAVAVTLVAQARLLLVANGQDGVHGVHGVVLFKVGEELYLFGEVVMVLW